MRKEFVVFVVGKSFSRMGHHTALREAERFSLRTKLEPLGVKKFDEWADARADSSCAGAAMDEERGVGSHFELCAFAGKYAD